VLPILHLAALFALALFLSLRWDAGLLRTLPAALCLTGLALYVLAFFGRLSWVDALAALLLAALAAAFLVRRRACAPRLLAALRDGRLWLCLAVLAALLLLVRGRLVLEWDAYNFWGADVRSLYYRDGFAAAYSNAAPAFGDYPPFLQLILWWFLHLAGRCDEGMMFVGYHALGALLLFTAADRPPAGDRLARLSGALACAVLPILLPSVFDSSWYRSLYVDPLMGFLFGALLIAAAREDVRALELSVYAAALALSKNVGSLWAFAGAVFCLLWHGRQRAPRRAALAMFAAAAAGMVSWRAFCRVMHRSGYLSAAFVPLLRARLAEVRAGAFLASGSNRALLRSFLRAFFSESVHRGRPALLSLTPCAALALLLALLVLLLVLGALPRKKAGRLIGFFLITAALTYGFLLLSHLTVFASEAQYLESANMLTQMTRYTAPLTLGCAMLLFSAAFRAPADAAAPRRILPAAVTAAAILLFAGYATMADAFVPGFDPLTPQRVARREEFRSAYAALLAQTADLPLDGEHRRVLVLTDASAFNPIVSFLASPASLWQEYCPAPSRETLAALLARSGAGWVFVQDGSPEALDAYRALIPDFAVQTVCAAPDLR